MIYSNTMEERSRNPAGMAYHTKNKNNIISPNNNMNLKTKNQLLRELLYGISLEDLQMLVDLKNKMHSKPIPTPRKSVNQMAQEYESSVIQPPPEFRDDYKPIPLPRTKKPIPAPRKSVNQMVQEYESNVIQPPLEYRDDYKPVPLPRTKKPIPAPRKSVNQMVQE